MRLADLQRALEADYNSKARWRSLRAASCSSLTAVWSTCCVESQSARNGFICNKRPPRLNVKNRAWIWLALRVSVRYDTGMDTTEAQAKEERMPTVDGWTHYRLVEYGVVQLAGRDKHAGCWVFSVKLKIGKHIQVWELDALWPIPLEDELALSEA